MRKSKTDEKGEMREGESEKRDGKKDKRKERC